MVKLSTLKNSKGRLKLFRNKKGISTLYVIIFLSIALPTMIFFTVDFPLMMATNRKVKATLDNAASTAILQIDETKASSGVLYIDEVESKKMAGRVIKETFVLSDDYSTKKGSLIVDTPTVDIVVFNNVKSTIYHNTLNGKFAINNPSVLVYAEVPVKGSFFRHSKKTIKYTAIAQVQFKK